MSGVDYDLFLKWATDRFGEENVKIRGEEICTHSFFAKEKGKDDYKYHLWMNPSGGKRKIPGGAYRCWYTDEMGSLISLVGKVDNIPYGEAEELICDITPFGVLEKKVEDFFSNGIKEEKTVESIEKTKIALPPFTYLIESLDSNNYYRINATKYLNRRKIPIEGLYVCIEGDCKNRIVIPYYDAYDQLIYYNARSLTDNKKSLRYMKPKEGSQENVLYFKEWPSPDNKIYITEGEFDAIVLNLAGFYGVACGGKFLSEEQINIIRHYKPVLAFDADDSGESALIKVGNDLLSNGFAEVHYVRPPKNYKDWNKLLQDRNIETVKAYINKFEKKFTTWTEDTLKAKKL